LKRETTNTLVLVKGVAKAQERELLTGLASVLDSATKRRLKNPRNPQREIS
jgi:hypothetical protein